MDVSMPILNGLEATRQIMGGRPSTKIIVLSAHVDEEYVERAKAVGAAGYLAKQMSAADLASLIHEVVAGRHLFDSVGSAIFSGGRDVQPERGGAANGKSETLTHRESEVLDLMAGGFHKTKIAAKLRISSAAVERHFGALMAKLRVPSIANLAAYAVATGYIENDVDLIIT
jgi:DNA-binding NarL/FixJ family response regulator